MRIALTICVRSVTPYAAVLIAVVSVGLATMSVRPGFLLWSDLVTGLSVSSVYTGCVAAGIAAYESGRWFEANRERSRFSVRSGPHVRAIHAAATVLPLLVGYALAVLALTFYAGGRGFYGAPNLWWLSSLAAALVAAAAAGYAIGALAGRRWWVPPAAALGFFACYIVSRGTTAPYGVVSLFPAVTNSDSEFVEYVTPTMVGQVGAWLGGSVLVIVLAGRLTHASRIALSGVVIIASASVIAGVASVVVTNGQYTTGYNDRDFVCEGDDTVVCLNPGYLPAMEPLLSAVGRFNAIAAGTRLVAERLEQNVEGVGDEPADGARSIYIEQLESEEDIDFAMYRYVSKYGAVQSCLAQSGDLSGLRLSATVDAWLSGYTAEAEGAGLGRGVRRLEQLSPREGAAWFSAHADDYFACTLHAEDLP